MKPAPTAALIAILISSAGCGSLEPQAVAGASSSCAAETAVITVGDGYVQSLCGCDENGAAPVTPVSAPAGDTLTCTIDAGTSVVFHYVSTSLMHQIVASDRQAFAASPVSDPMDTNPVRVHRVTFDQAGSFEFVDTFNSAVGGTFIVN